MNPQSARKKACIDETGLYLSSPMGESMRPFLREGVTVAVAAVEGEVRRGDILLYEDADGRQVLHRVVGKTKDGKLRMRGDNCLAAEPPLSPDLVIGRMIGYWKGERYTDCRRSLSFCLFSRLWLFLYPVRAPFLWLRARLRRKRTEAKRPKADR